MLIVIFPLFQLSPLVNYYSSKIRVAFSCHVFSTNGHSCKIFLLQYWAFGNQQLAFGNQQLIQLLQLVLLLCWYSFCGIICNNLPQVVVKFHNFLFQLNLNLSDLRRESRNNLEHQCDMYLYLHTTRHAFNPDAFMITDITLKHLVCHQ